jgi:hypothetical protein
MPILPVITHTGAAERARSHGHSTWIVAACWVLGLWAAALAGSTAYLYLVTAGSFDYVEGVALGHQLITAGGVPLYGVPADQPPYSVPLYGPVFYTIYGLLLDTASPSFSPPRVLNLALTLYLCGLALLVARQRLGVSTAAASLAVLCWLSLEPAAGFLLQNRPDTLALAFAASGFMAAISGRRYSLPLAVLLLTAAAYTKQTAVVAPLIAASLVLLGTRRVRDAAVLLLSTLTLCLAILLVLNGLTDGGYWSAAVLGNLNGFSPGSALVAWQKASQQPLFWLALAALLTNLRATGASRGIAIYGLASLALHGLAVAKPGANSNYFLEYSWCAALALAPLLDDVLREPARWHRGLITALVLLTCSISLGLATLSLQRLHQTAEDWPRNRDWLTQWEAEANGPVASMQPGIQILNGNVPYILDPHIIARLSEQGRFDEQGFLDDLRNARIGAVIGADDLTAGPDDFSNWSLAVRKALQDHYVKTDTLDRLSVWLPKKDHQATRPAISR